LLERRREFFMLGECLEAVQGSSRGSVVVIGGEAGVGKTALVRRFCEEHRGSVRILWGACDPLFTPRPLGPLLDVAESAGRELDDLLESGARAHEVVAGLMRELQRRAPTALVLEDVHWADEATLDVLRLLARKVEAVPALVLATCGCQTPGVVPEAPLRMSRNGLVTDGEGWFVVNARESRWRETGPLGAFCTFEGKRRFPHFGISVSVLESGEAMAMYHRENAQEAFLVLSGTCTLVVEG
jgi:hypothetical protein